jgi:hypothetical protein
VAERVPLDRTESGLPARAPERVTQPRVLQHRAIHRAEHERTSQVTVRFERRNRVVGERDLAPLARLRRSDPRCGIHLNRDDDPGEPWTIGPAPDAGYDGIYRVGPTVASLPARG